MAKVSHYDRVGFSYNETRCADPYLVSRFREFLCPRMNGNYLDVGCGTGNYTCALSNDEYQFYGIDPSSEMLKQARAKDCSVIWLQGSAEDLPFADGFFAGAICSLTIHHWDDLTKAFGEIGRILEPGAYLVLFTAFAEQMAHYWLNHYFPNALRDSASQMPSFLAVKEALDAAGFRILERENYFVRDDLADHFLYCGKNRPELYLRADIRRGISTFSSLANKDEVETGLRLLAADIRESHISGIIEKYQSSEGDYAFIVAGKKS